MVPSPSGEQTTAPRSGGVALSKWLLHHEFRDDADATSTTSAFEVRAFRRPSFHSASSLGAPVSLASPGCGCVQQSRTSGISEKMH